MFPTVFWGAEHVPSLRIPKFQLHWGVPGGFRRFPALSARRSHQDLVDRSGHKAWGHKPMLYNGSWYLFEALHVLRSFKIKLFTVIMI